MRQPARIRLKRRTFADDGAGGRVQVSEILLPEQTFRIAATARQHDQTATTTSGEQQGGDWLLIGAQDANVLAGDEFETGGRWWRVKFVDPNRNWRTAAAVVEHGRPRA